MKGMVMAKTAQEKVRDYRNRLRAAGLRPIQVWVPDTRQSDFAKKARKQSLLAAKSKVEAEALEVIEELADFSEV